MLIALPAGFSAAFREAYTLLFAWTVDWFGLYWIVCIVKLPGQHASFYIQLYASSASGLEILWSVYRQDKEGNKHAQVLAK